MQTTYRRVALFLTPVAQSRPSAARLPDPTANGDGLNAADFPDEIEVHQAF